MLWGPALAHAAAQPTYYLALGDSLAQGVQPSASGVDVATNQGYADDLYALFRRRVPGLSLAKLGCSGENTMTMIYGGVCAYAEPSQLDAAVSFLQTHKVSIVTLDIGANDIDQCINLTTLMIEAGCVTEGLNSVLTNLPLILTELREAAGPDTLIVAMNYYDPFLAAWKLVPPPNGQALANASLLVTGSTGLNGVLEGVYQEFGIPVADVANAYRISDFTPVPVLNLPLNVFLTLIWTWMDAPLGPDVHPNAVGYAVIAGAFANKISMR
jgi:lysophospholipase L1-like esterase